MTLLTCKAWEARSPTGSEATPDWAGSFGTFASAPTPRTGAVAILQSSSAGPRFAAHSGDDHATFIVGFAHYQFNAGPHDLCRFFGDAVRVLSANAGTLHVTVHTNGANITVYRGSSAGTLLGTATATPLLGSTWQYIEVKVVLSDTVGSVEVRVDETVVLTLTGIDTKNGGTDTTISAVEWFSYTAGFGTGWDDHYVCNGAGSTNNDYLGAVHVESLAPSGNGNSSQWTNDLGNSTNNYSHVDDSAFQADITDYVETSTTNNEDTYAFADSAFGTGNTVKAVVVKAYAEKTDAGARELQFVARLSGTETTATASEVLINGTYQWLQGVFDTKPGGGAWTVADVNNAEFGIKAV